MSSVAQWKRAGPITQRSMDRNHPLLPFFFHCIPIILERFLQNSPSWHHPLIAQLVERRTVVGLQASLGRWFESGSRDNFFDKDQGNP